MSTASPTLASGRGESDEDGPAEMLQECYACSSYTFNSILRGKTKPKGKSYSMVNQIPRWQVGGTRSEIEDKLQTQDKGLFSIF